MLNVGVGEMMVILLVALVVFGPNRLPEIARSVGKFMRNFQKETTRALNDLKEGIDMKDVKDAVEPFKVGILDEPDGAANGVKPSRPAGKNQNWLDIPGFKPAFGGKGRPRPERPGLPGAFRPASKAGIFGALMDAANEPVSKPVSEPAPPAAETAQPAAETGDAER